MSDSDRYPYLAGIVEGLAYARLRQDGNDPEGMACIYAWFYEDENAIPNIYQAFDHFRDRAPGAVVAALIERRCGG